MTPINAILILACCLAFARWPSIWPLALVAVAAVAAFALEGWRNPLLPAYAVAAALLIAALLPMQRAPWGLQRLGMLVGLLLLAASVVACIVLPLRKFPATAGPYAVGSEAVPADLVARYVPAGSTSPARAAPLARLWYPARKPPEQSWVGRLFKPRDREPALEGAPLGGTVERFPVIVYFSGWPSTAIQNYVLIRELASRGFVVMGLTYPSKLPSMSDEQFARELAQFNQPWDYSTQAGAARMEEFFERRVRESALDASAMVELLGAANGQGAANEQVTLSRFRGRLALDRLGLLGFSMGGGVAAQAGTVDPRFGAVVNMDGWHWHEALSQGVPRPYLHIGRPLEMPRTADLESPNLDTRYGAERQRTEFINVPRVLARHGGLQVTLAGMTHSNFTDMNLRSPLARLRGGGAIDRFRALQVVDDYVCGFFERELQGRTEPWLDGDSSRYPEARVRVWPAPAGAAAPPPAP